VIKSLKSSIFTFFTLHILLVAPPLLLITEEAESLHDSVLAGLILNSDLLAGAKHVIHLLESKPFGLRDEEQDEESSHNGKQAEEDKRAIANVLKHRRSNLSNNEVVHPIGRSCDGETLSTNT